MTRRPGLRLFGSLVALGCLWFYVAFGEGETARFMCALLSLFGIAEVWSDIGALRSLFPIGPAGDEK